jgi:hypothetical protein
MVARIYNKLNTVPEHRVHEVACALHFVSFLTVFQMF